jgi:hypothetical protein
MKYAHKTQPAMLPNNETVQLRATAPTETWPESREGNIMRMSPVKRSPLVKRIASNPTGKKTAPRTPPPTAKSKCVAIAM